MQMPIFKGVLNAYPLSNPVGQRDNGQMMNITPPNSFQRSTGCTASMQMPPTRTLPHLWGEGGSF